MKGYANLFAALLIAAVACATPPESPGPTVAKTPGPTPAASTPEREKEPEPEPSAQQKTTQDASASEGCAEESETVPVVISVQHARGNKRGGFVAKMQAPPLKLNETLIDTTTLKGSYTCCVHTEVESVRFECELPDGNSLGRVYREKDDIVIDSGEGHDSKRLPIPCGAWLRFRGPVKDCESSPP
jgi:hypothetical protein